jgi:hypothetical protein
VGPELFTNPAKPSAEMLGGELGRHMNQQGELLLIPLLRDRKAAFQEVYENGL